MKWARMSRGPLTASTGQLCPESTTNKQQTNNIMKLEIQDKQTHAQAIQLQYSTVKGFKLLQSFGTIK